MKLNTWNRKQCNRGLSDKLPRVSLEKNGVIKFNQQLVAGLGFKVGDKVNLCQDEERPGDWYIEKTTDVFGLVLRKHSNAGCLCTSGKMIVSAVQKSLQLNEKTLSFRVSLQTAVDGTDLHAIITR